MKTNKSTATVADEVQVGNAVAGAVYLGDGLYKVADKFIHLDGAKGLVLEALVELRAGSFEQLADRSSVPNPSAVLKSIRKNIPVFAPFITLPGGKGKGGYSTSIVDGRTKQI